MSAKEKSSDLAATVKAKGDALTNGDTIFALIEKYKPQIDRALAGAIDADRFARVVATEVRRTPQLQNCDPKSFLGSLLLSAQLGLEPGVLGHCFFVPFGKECQLIIGYKGYIWLAWNASQIVIDAFEVREHDEFSFDQGLQQVSHRYDLRKDRGDLIGVWAQAVLPNGMKKVRPMSLSEVEAHRNKSKLANGPAWSEHYVPMALKTVIRVLMSQLPLAAKVQRAIAADETSAMAKPAGETVEVEAEIVPDGEKDIVEVGSGFPTPMVGGE